MFLNLILNRWVVGAGFALMVAALWGCSTESPYLSEPVEPSISEPAITGNDMNVEPGETPFPVPEPGVRDAKEPEGFWPSTEIFA